MILYTIGCPRCNVLKRKLDELNLKYIIQNDENIIISEGLDEMPVLEIEDGRRMGFSEAIEWLKKWLK